MQDLRAHLDLGKKLPFPDGILINGRGPGGASFNVEQGIYSQSSIQNLIFLHFLFSIFFFSEKKERTM